MATPTFEGLPTEPLIIILRHVPFEDIYPEEESVSFGCTLQKVDVLYDFPRHYDTYTAIGPDFLYRVLHADRLTRRNMILVNTWHGAWPGFIGPGILIDRDERMPYIAPADRHQTPNLEQFWSSIAAENNIKSSFNKASTAADAWQRIRHLYGGAKRYNFSSKVDAFLDVAYQPGGNHTAFLHKFHTAVEEMEESLGPNREVPVAFKYSVFLRAVRHNPAAQDWIRSAKFELDDENVLEHAIADFVTFEQRQKELRVSHFAAH